MKKQISHRGSIISIKSHYYNKLRMSSIINTLISILMSIKTLLGTMMMNCWMVSQPQQTNYKRVEYSDREVA